MTTKSRLEEVQDRMMWTFTAMMMLLFFSVTFTGCGLLAYQHGSEVLGCALMAVGMALLYPMFLAGQRFITLGAEEERLAMQPEDPDPS